jgi:hypothetical protein
MKKDIHIPKVTNVAIAIVNENEDWFAYLINNNNFSLENTLISSKGYGVIDSKPKKTTFFSHYLGTIDSMSYRKVELLNKDVFGLTNEFLLTFYVEDVIHDKKYIFLPESIISENSTKLPLMKRKGIMIK